MEYSRSFALVEAAFLIGLTGWLVYLNASSRRGDSDQKDAGQREEKGRQKENGGS